MSLGVSAQASINLALNKPAWATVDRDVPTAKYAVDGVINTAWNAGDHAGDISMPVILTVDLERIYEIDSIHLWTSKGGPHAGYYIDYNLYCSTDQSNLVFLEYGRLIDTYDPSDEYKLLDVQMRYVHFEVTGGTHWASLFEMEVYEIPEPVSLTLFGLGVILLRKRN